MEHQTLGFVSTGCTSITQVASKSKVSVSSCKKIRASPRSTRRVSLQMLTPPSDENLAPPEVTKSKPLVAPTPATMDELVGLYQLDELEDKDRSATAIKLNPNGDLSVGKTDGPIPAKVSGKWTVEGASFSMILDRSFEGKEGALYTVSREYTGTVQKNESYTEISGEIRMKFPVGYFMLFQSKEDIFGFEELMEFK